MKYPQIVPMPSAVSNWLEEQLEARGIDAVVYTRYILSLLHSDAVDVILAEEDQQFSHLKKEVRRSGGSYKCFRRSSDWWKYAQAEAEQLKRSAAVECLLSASEQNCGIESLIDELCEKLKEIKSDVEQRESTPSTPPTEDTNNTTTTTDSSDLKIKESTEISSELQSVVSPQELAKRYYAAFPPLNRNSSNSPTKLISLIPKWIPSPNNNNNNKTINNNTKNNQKNVVIAPTTPKKRTTYDKNNYYYNENMKSFKNHFGGRQRSTNTAATTTTTSTNYNNNYFNRNNNNNNKKEMKYKGNGKGGGGKIEKIRLNSPMDFDNMDARVTGDDDFKNWNNYDDDDQNMMYDDLPVDIRELLNDSPQPSNNDDTVEMMNLANMRDTGRRGFIQCGTNILTSIWSTADAMDDDDNTTTTTTGFNNKIVGNNLPSDYHLNTSFDNWSFNDDTITNTNTNNYWQWSDNIYNNKNDEPIIDQHLSLSFLKINHNKESSAFCPVISRSNSTGFNHSLNQLKNYSNVPLKTIHNNNNNNNGGEKVDDLLTSKNSHFKPINEPTEQQQQQGQYADGATFVISNNLDKVNYKRSESGAMYLESDYGTRKKYCEYKTINNNKTEFTLKFIVCQNDKACQTDATTSAFANYQNDEEVECIVDDNKKDNVMSFKCTCPINNSNNNDDNNDQAMNTDIAINCPLHPLSPTPLTSTDNALDELLWKYNGTCDKCNDDINGGSNNNDDDVNWNMDAKINDKDIWKGDEICLSCLRKNTCRPPAKLEEDIMQDGVQLLSDLSSLQKSIMEEQRSMEYICDQVNTGCNLSEMLIPKRRHSTDHENNSLNSCWSFASRLEEDCLMQMSTIPTLRSVTL